MDPNVNASHRIIPLSTGNVGRVQGGAGEDESAADQGGQAQAEGHGRQRQPVERHRTGISVTYFLPRTIIPLRTETTKMQADPTKME